MGDRRQQQQRREDRDRDRDRDTDRDNEPLPFANLDKSAVIQQTRHFNDTPLRTSLCREVLSKLLYLFSQGSTSITRSEATDVFFNAVKLFQSQDIVFRRLLYIVLKELAPHAEDILIAVNSLAKDVNGKNEIYRAAAMRSLLIIADPSMLGPIERYMRQAVVDRSGLVASAALVSGIKLFAGIPDTIRRWVSEVQEAVTNGGSRGGMVQYHALALLYRIKSGDRLSVSKVLTSAMGAMKGGNSSAGLVLLIRYVSGMLADGGLGSSVQREWLSFLDGCLRHKSEPVQLEAARAISNAPGLTSRDLAAALSVLQLFLSSGRPVLRYSAVRTLEAVAMKYPAAVQSLVVDMESLVGDPNRSIATMAIATLLKVGSESSLDRLLSQVSGMMGDISDEFRVVVVHALQELVRKFPVKARAVLGFLGDCLHDEGGFDYKKCVVETIIDVLAISSPADKEKALLTLCEFIEDCEYPPLAQQVLHVLGREGPAMATPSRYLRYVYNRLILENAAIRASAMNALGRFGLLTTDDGLRRSVAALLRRSLADNDDEVRDRAILWLAALESLPSAKADGGLSTVLLKEFKVPLAMLERYLLEYAGSSQMTQEVDLLAEVDHMSKQQEPQLIMSQKPGDSSQLPSQTLQHSGSAGLLVPQQQLQLQQQQQQQPAPPRQQQQPSQRQQRQGLAQKPLPGLEHLGMVACSSDSSPLTEAGTEYAVRCIRHVMQDHKDVVVCEFLCMNTVEDLMLEDVSVKMVFDDGSASYVPEAILPIPQLAFSTNIEASTFVVLRMQQADGAVPVSSSSSCMLQFVVKEADNPDAEGDEDEYRLQDVEICVGDFVSGSGVDEAAVADMVPPSASALEPLKDTFELSTMKSVDAAAKGIRDLYRGCRVVREAAATAAGGRQKQEMVLAGFWRGLPTSRVRIDCLLAGAAGGVPALQIAVRADDRSVAELLLSAIA